MSLGVDKGDQINLVGLLIYLIAVVSPASYLVMISLQKVITISGPRIFIGMNSTAEKNGRLIFFGIDIIRYFQRIHN